MAIVHYCEHVYQTGFFAETSAQPCKERKLIGKIPKGSLGYRFYDKTEAVVDGEKVSGVPKNFSPWVYIGKRETVADVKARKNADDKILIANMESNGYEAICRTYRGTCYPLSKGDSVIEPPDYLLKKLD